MDKVRTAAVAVLTAVVLLTIYLLRLDPVVGQFKDDAWYVILAKSLATGRGYNLINYPGHSGLYFYPPFFPLLLSVLYRVHPDFPANVFLLKSLSILSMGIVCLLVFRLFSRADRLPPTLAYLVAFATAAAPSFVMLATSTLMSECVFAALQFGTLLLAERCLDRDRSTKLTIIALALLAVCSYLTRSIGIVLIAAIAIEILRRRKYRQLAIFCIAVVIFVAPWIIYKQVRTSAESRAGRVAESYSDQFWDRLASSGEKVGMRDIPARVRQVSCAIIADAVGGILVPSLYRTSNESGEELVDMTAIIRGISGDAFHGGEGTMGINREAQLLSLMFSILVGIGFVSACKTRVGLLELVFSFSLIMVVLWPWSPIRFLVPLLPLFLYYLALAVTLIVEFVAKRKGGRLEHDPWQASRVVVACILALFLYDNALYARAKQTPLESGQHPDWLRRFESSRQAAEWIQDHTPHTEVVTGDNLPAIYLYAHRDTDVCNKDDCAQKGIRYFVNTSEDRAVPGHGQTVFRTSYHGVEVLELTAPGK